MSIAPGDTTTISGISSTVGVYLSGTAGTIRVGDIPGTTAVYFSPGSPRVSVGAADSPSIDAFSRWRSSEPTGIFDSTFQYDIQPILFNTGAAGGAVAQHDANMASARLNTTGAAGGSITIQSKAYHRYIPAKSQLVVLTQVLDEGTSGLVKQVGYFDHNDGIFLHVSSGTAYIARRSSVSGTPVDEYVQQVNWNLDPLDGSGPSGKSLDLTKSSIFLMDLQWLGMGRVRAGFDIDGAIVYAHEFKHAGILATPYMRTANLPVRWHMEGNVEGTMYATCSAVISEGGAEFNRGFPFTIANTVGTSAVQSVRTAILSIRPKSTFNSIVNRIQVEIDEFAGMVTGNSPVLLELLYNSTVTSGEWVSAGASSAVEYNRTNTALADGTALSSILVAATNQQKNSTDKSIEISRNPITLDIDGLNPICVTLCASGIGGASQTYGRINWREIR